MEYGGENRLFEVAEWKWEEFPYSEEEWNSMFFESALFSLEEYEKILYQSIGADVFMLFADGELWFIQLFPDNRNHGAYWVWSIDKLIPLE